VREREREASTCNHGPTISHHVFECSVVLVLVVFVPLFILAHVCAVPCESEELLFSFWCFFWNVFIKSLLIKHMVSDGFTLFFFKQIVFRYVVSVTWSTRFGRQQNEVHSMLLIFLFSSPLLWLWKFWMFPKKVETSFLFLFIQKTSCVFSVHYHLDNSLSAEQIKPIEHSFYRVLLWCFSFLHYESFDKEDCDKIRS